MLIQGSKKEKLLSKSFTLKVIGEKEIDLNENDFFIWNPTFESFTNHAIKVIVCGYRSASDCFVSKILPSVFLTFYEVFVLFFMNLRYPPDVYQFIINKLVTIISKTTNCSWTAK